MDEINLRFEVEDSLTAEALMVMVGEHVREVISAVVLKSDGHGCLFEDDETAVRWADSRG